MSERRIGTILQKDEINKIKDREYRRKKKELLKNE